jgi:tetratricopeptide (TPR) repeat protein
MNAKTFFPAALILLAAMIGCTSLGLRREKSDAVFSRRDTARDQYYDAAQFDKKTILGKDQAENRKKMLRVVAGYRMLPDHFADDPYYTPLAVASMADKYFQMGEYKRTIRLYEDLKKKHPRYPYVHAKAEYKIGECYEKLGQAAIAKQYYKRCFDTFRYDQNDRIKMIVALAYQKWNPPTIVGEKKPPREESTR